jgi:hypothetical protein
MTHPVAEMRRSAVWRWFGPPVFASAEQTAKARMFWLLASSAFVLTLFGVAVLLIVESL